MFPDLIARCTNTNILKLFYLAQQALLTFILAGTAYNTYSLVYTSFVQGSHPLDCLLAHSHVFEICHILLSGEIANTGEQIGQERVLNLPLNSERPVLSHTLVV